MACHKLIYLLHINKTSWFCSKKQSTSRNPVQAPEGRAYKWQAVSPTQNLENKHLSFQHSTLWWFPQLRSPAENLVGCIGGCAWSSWPPLLGCLKRLDWGSSSLFAYGPQEGCSVCPRMIPCHDTVCPFQWFQAKGAWPSSQSIIIWKETYHQINIWRKKVCFSSRVANKSCLVQLLSHLATEGKCDAHVTKHRQT